MWSSLKFLRSFSGFSPLVMVVTLEADDDHSINQDTTLVNEMRKAKKNKKASFLEAVIDVCVFTCCITSRSSPKTKTGEKGQDQEAKNILQ